MSRNRFLFTFLSVAILLTMVLVACAPAAPAKPATPPATTTPPAATPPAVTTPPVAPPAPPAPPPAAPAAPIKTSYDAKAYTNDQYGFSFLYPSTMVSATPKAKYNVFEAADPMQVPAVGASVLDTAKVEAQTEESLKSTGGSNIKTVSSEPMTLADGKTKGTFTQLTWKSSGYDITTYSAAAEKGDKTISVSYTSLTDMIDAKIAKEVVFTLTVK
jgi:hypothetical protein